MTPVRFSGLEPDTSGRRLFTRQAAVGALEYEEIRTCASTRQYERPPSSATNGLV